MELIDFKNPDYSELGVKEKEKINNFIKKVEINNANIFKEYEFICNENSTTYHGIIDLMLEYPDNIKIIDYKLKNIHDDDYLKQLNGYKRYIQKTYNKETKIFLYSILDDHLEEIN